MLTVKQVETIGTDVYKVINNTSGHIFAEFETKDEAQTYIDDFGQDDRIVALAEFLECGLDVIENECGNTYSWGKYEYLVLMDDEADTAWEESLDSYIDECIISCVGDKHIQQLLENYFDRDKWKHDARFDGRGHSLSSYDGEENESGEYFIYRIN